MSEFRLFSPESRVTLIGGRREMASVGSELTLSRTESSLSWDSFEQKCFWDLLRADLLDRPREIEPLVGMIGRIDLTGTLKTW